MTTNGGGRAFPSNIDPIRQLAMANPGDVVEVFMETAYVVKTVFQCREMVGNQPYEWRWMFLDDDSDDAGLDVHVGFYLENNPINERVVLRILPNGGDSWRFRMAVNTSQGTRIDAPLGFDSVPLSWSFDWTPSGAGDGTGTATGTVSDGVTTLTLPAPIPALDAWEKMLPTAQRMAELLDGVVLDESRNALGRQRIAHLRDELRAYDRQHEAPPISKNTRW